MAAVAGSLPSASDHISQVFSHEHENKRRVAKLQLTKYYLLNMETVS